MKYHQGGRCGVDGGHHHSIWYTVVDIERLEEIITTKFKRKICVAVLFGVGSKLPSTFWIKVDANEATESNMYRYVTVRCVNTN